MRKRFFFSITAGASLIISAAVIAQQAGGGNPSNLPPNYPPFLSPQQLQQLNQGLTKFRAEQDAKMKARVQADLDVAGDEMDVIWTKFHAVVDARHLALRSNASIAKNWQQLQPPLDDYTRAVIALAKAEQDPAATPDLLADLMDDVRQLQHKGQADFLATQDDMKKLLNTWQEAVLMNWGILN